MQEEDVKPKVGAVDKDNIKLRWRKGKKAPYVMYRYCDAVTDNTTVYCKHDSNKVYAYHVSSSCWSPIPDSLYGGFALAVIDGLLTTVGGFLSTSGENINKLYSLTGRGSGRKWTMIFPSMPTKRYCVSALCTGTALIAAGGYGRDGYGCGDKEQDEILKTVEVLNMETQQWHTTADIPRSLVHSSLTLCGDLVYLLGGFNKDNKFTSSVYSCSLTSLLLSTGSTSLGGHLMLKPTQSSKHSPWKRVAYSPLRRSTAVSLHGRLLAIGGRNSKNSCLYVPANH